MPSVPILGLAFRRCYRISLTARTFQVTSEPGMSLPWVTYTHSYSSDQTQPTSSHPSSLISATHNLRTSSRTPQYREDTQSSCLLVDLHCQKKISRITEKSCKILRKEIWQMWQAELEHALFFLLEQVYQSMQLLHMHSLSHVCMHTHTHNIPFLREKTTLAFLSQNCWLNTEPSTATQHKSACIPSIPELRRRKKQLHVLYAPALHAGIWLYFVLSKYKVHLCYLSAWRTPSPITCRSPELSMVGTFIFWAGNSPDQSQPVQRWCYSLLLEPHQ